MKTTLVTRLLASTSALALVAALASGGLAQSPQGPVVASGAVTVTRQGSTTVVTQGSDKGVIDWRSFSIGPQEGVRFDQPGRSSITLNRVTGSDLSRIDGNLSANGQVWLSNPNGVLVGPGGRVDVGSLLATTGRIDAQEFLRSGKALIDQIPKDAAILNAGSIAVGVGGYAALAAAAVKNEGVISARAGTVALGSGKAMTLDFTGDKLIAFQVTKPLEEAPAGAEALISDTGTISAPGGTVLLSARAAKGVIDSAINLQGHVIAKEIRVDGGTVMLGDGGAVKIAGKLDASDSSGVGGVIAISGPEVTVTAPALLDASGEAGGDIRLDARPSGKVSIAGTLRADGLRRSAGSVVAKAATVEVKPTARISANALETGAGGAITLASHGDVRLAGSLSVDARDGGGGSVAVAGGLSIQLEGAQITAIGQSGGGTISIGAYVTDAGIIVPVAQVLSVTRSRLDASALPMVRILDDGRMVNVPAPGVVGGQVSLQAAQLSMGEGATVLADGDRGGAIRVSVKESYLASLGARLQADAVGGQGGEVTIAGTLGDDGRSSAQILSAGAISARSRSGMGGAASLLADKIGLTDGAAVDASGGAGGGTVLVGGDWQGKGPTQTARFAYVAPTASITVDATESGVGGKAVVWSDDATRFQGRISARGGPRGGDGGQVETSGKRGLDVASAAIVDASARSQNSKAGNWLLDPSDISIENGGGATGIVGGIFDPLGAASTIDPSYIATQLALTSVTLQTSSGGGGQGDITFTSGTINYTGAGASTLTLKADRDIVFLDGTKILASSTGALDVTLNSGAASTMTTQNAVVGGINLGTATIATNGGAIRLVGGDAGTLAAQGSVATHNGVAASGATLNAGAGSILIKGVGRPTDTGANVHGMNLVGSTLTGSGGITLDGLGGDSAADDGGHGVRLTNTGIATNGGTLSIKGLSQAPGARQYGVHISTTNGAILSLGAGALSINGTASPQGAAAGVALVGTSTITGAGAMVITGVAGATSAGVLGTSGVLIDNSAISVTSSAALSITGTRGNAPASAYNILLNNAKLATNGGSITLLGASTFGGGGVSLNSGVALIGSSVTSTGGAISITGTGAANGSLNHGVQIRASSLVDAGSGDVTITGVRGSNSESAINVLLGTGGTVKTTGGNISLVGASTVGGLATANDGVDLNSGSLIVTDTGTMTLSGAGAAGGTGNLGVYVNGGITVTGTGGAIILRSVGGGPSSSGDINLQSSGSIVYAGAGTADLKILADRDIQFFAGSRITASNGALTTSLVSGATESSQGGVVGAIKLDTTTITTNGGDLLLAGGDKGTLSAQGSPSLIHGVYVTGSTLSSAGGSIAVRGIGRPGDTSSDVFGVFIDNSRLLSSNGVSGVKLDGTGGDAATGRSIGARISNSRIDLSSAASLAVAGTAPGDGPNRAGVSLDGGSTLSFVGGSVSLTGSATGGVGSNQNGVTINDASKILGAGSVSITGTGGGDGSNNQGVVGLGGSLIQISSGDLQITGTGGGGGFSAGVALGDGATGITVENTGAGSIVVNGTAVGTNVQNRGVGVSSGSKVLASGTGGVTIVGQRGSGDNSENILVTDLGTEVSAVAGAVTLDGSYAGGAGNANHGVRVTASAVVGRGGASGLVTLSGVGGLGNGIDVDGAITTGAGGLVLDADSINLSGAANSIVGSGTLTVRPISDSTAIGLGDGAAGALRLDSAFFAPISGFASLIVGRSDGTGAIEIAPGHVAARNLAIRSDSGPVTFQGDVNAAAHGGQSLKLDVGGATISFAGGVGSTTPFSALDIGASRTNSEILFTGTSVATTGAQTYGGKVTLASGSATRFTTDNANVSFAPGFDSGITVAVAGDGLIVDSGRGSVLLQGATLTSLSLLGSGAVTTGGRIFTSGSQLYPGPVTLGRHTTFETANGDITFSGPVNGSTDGGESFVAILNGASGSALTPNAFTGKLSLTNGAGATTALHSLLAVHRNVIGAGSIFFYGATILGGTIRTAGSQNYDSVALASDTTLSTTDSPIYFRSSLDGPGRLTLSTGTGTIYAPQRVGVTNVIEYPTLVGLTQFGALASTDSVASVTSMPSIPSRPTSNGAAQPSFSSVASVPSFPSAGSAPSSPSFASIASIQSISAGPATLATIPSSSSRASISSVPSQSSIAAYAAGVSGPSFDSRSSVGSVASVAQTFAGPSLPSYPSYDSVASVASVPSSASGPSVASIPSVASRGSTPSYAAGPFGPSMQSLPTLPSIPSSASGAGFALISQVAPNPVATTPAGPTGPTSQTGPTSSTTLPGTTPGPIAGPAVPTSLTTASIPSQASSPVLPAPAPAIPSPVLADTGVTRAIETLAAAALNERVNSLLSSITGAPNLAPPILSVSYDREQNAVSVTVSSAAVRDLIKSAGVGSLIGFMPELVPGTGAPLTAAITVKVDPLDTGGGTGQAIAIVGASSKLGSETLLPNLLVRKPASASSMMPAGEPPLDQQGSTLNDEMLMD